MNDPSRVRVDGALAQYAEGFVAELRWLGYTPVSSSHQLRLTAHLSRWLSGEGLDESALTPERMTEFLVSRRAAGYTNYLSVKALVPLIDYLRRLGVAPPTPVLVLTPTDVLLGRFRAYLVGERGLVVTTGRDYVDMVRPFVTSRVRPDGELDLSLTAGDVTRFVLAQAPRRGRGSAKLMVTALRSLLGFLHIDGVLAASLVGAVPSVAGWQLAGLPRGLDAGQVRALLDSCDRHTAVGLRDFAVMTMMVRLGLRRGEIARLRLDDVDWRGGQITVCGKADRRERLPLPADVGEALVAYLRRGRPVAFGDCRRLFLRTRAPHRELTPGGVTQIVVTAAERAGLDPIAAHRLRHTTATTLLRSGAPLSEVGELLRHRRALTTAIYAKVDRDALRTIARPWPGSAA
jgi:site-specific recombinase XerD